MRWFIKFFLVLLVLLVSGYVATMYYFVEEKKVFVVEKNIDFPVDKVFPQFDNWQNFTRWYQYFSSEKEYQFSYFTPYEGQGSAMSFGQKEDKHYGQGFIKYSNPEKGIKYEIFEKGEKKPFKIDVKFIPKGESTKVIWHIERPEMPLLVFLMKTTIQGDDAENIGASMKKLSNTLAGKVDREIMLSNIRYDSIMIEEQEQRLFVGINVSTSNKKGVLFKNILINHNKIINFVSKDLAKKEDEYGEPVLFTDVNGLKKGEISYFYGVPLSKQVQLNDNNFVFKNVGKTMYYSIYYKGQYEQRNKAIIKLLNKINSDDLVNIGPLEELFIEPPADSREVLLKLSLPVTK